MPAQTEKPKPSGRVEPGDGLTQSERFMKAARDLECDDDPERFAERVRKLAKAPPMPQAKTGKSER